MLDADRADRQEPLSDGSLAETLSLAEPVFSSESPVDAPQTAATASAAAEEAMFEPPTASDFDALIALHPGPNDNVRITDLEPVVDAKPGKARKAKPDRAKKPAKADRAPPSVDTGDEAVSPTLVGGPKPIGLPRWASRAYLAAAVLAMVWSGMMIAFCLAYQFRWGAFEYAPFPPVVFGALAVLPAGFMLVGAFVLRQAAQLALETGRARALAEDLAIPAALAADQAGGAAEAVRREVALATQAGEAAERQLQALRQALAEESARLIAATTDAERAAQALTESLSRERAEMASLTAGLDQQVEAVNDAIGRQTRMVVETSDLAAAQLQEAEATLAARTGDLTTAAVEAGDAAELAGEALSRQADRLQNAGELVGNRLAGLNDEFARGHNRLADLAVQLQADQQALSHRLEGQRLAALAAAADAEATASSLTGVAETTAATLRDLIAEADQRLRAVAQSVQGEQAALDARSRAALSLFRDAVAEERSAITNETEAALGALTDAARTARTTTAAELRAVTAETEAALGALTDTARTARAAAAAELEAVERSVAAQAEAARASVEQLGEAAFAAAQKADQAFDMRINAARRAIEQSATLIGDAGVGAVSRIDAGLAAARSALAEVEAMLT